MTSSFPNIDTLCFFTSANPPTRGHVAAVKQALAEIPGIKELLIIPPPIHVWSKGLAPFEDRVAMLNLTFDGVDPRIQISTLERDEHLSSYTIDTLPVLKKMGKGSIGILMGADSSAVFNKWKAWEEDLSLAYLFIAPRDGISQQQRITDLPIEVKAYVGTRIFFLLDRDDETVLCSSTRARKEIQESGKSEDVIFDVLRFIQQKKLY